MLSHSEHDPTPHSTTDKLDNIGKDERKKYMVQNQKVRWVMPPHWLEPEIAMMGKLPAVFFFTTYHRRPCCSGRSPNGCCSHACSLGPGNFEYSQRCNRHCCLRSLYIESDASLSGHDTHFLVIVVTQHCFAAVAAHSAIRCSALSGLVAAVIM